MTLSRQARRIACHEAGHAIASVRLDLPFEFVTIDPDRLLKEFADGWSCQRSTEGRDDDEIIVDLAGYFADRKAGIADRQQAESGADSDFKNAQRRLPKATVQLHYLVRRAEHLVEDNWGAIVNVAFNLLACPYLDAEQVRSILETGYCPRKEPPALPLELASVDTSELERQLVAEAKEFHRGLDKHLVVQTVRLRGWPNEGRR